MRFCLSLHLIIDVYEILYMAYLIWIDPLTITKKSNGSARSTPWLTPECYLARLNYQDVISGTERGIVRTAYRSTVVSAEREFKSGT